jgi:formylglycine-generating enzyme required for sulfatase activity
MSAALVLVFAGALFQTQDADDLDRLKDSVQSLTSSNLWDRANEAIRRFGESHPSSTGEAQYKLLLRTTQDLAKESDGLFEKAMAESQDLLRQEHWAKAIARAAEAVAFYPERDARAKDVKDRARVGLAGKDLIRIPSKACWVGSNDHPDERPLREVTLREFRVDKYPVTNEDYLAFVAATGASAPPHWTKGKPAKNREDHPVTFVRFEDAAAFARWLGKRLPTAEEWEVAARGADRREFPWGNTFREVEDRIPANCLEYWQVHKSQPPGPTPVQFFAAQGFSSSCGAAMGGNVWEWTSTSVPGTVAGKAAEFRILKGGSFMVPSRSLRCATVLPENPALPFPDTGFRCVKDVPP